MDPARSRFGELRRRIGSEETPSDSTKEIPELNGTDPNLCKKLTGPTTQGRRQQRKSSKATDGRRYRGEEAAEAEGSGQELNRRAAAEDWIGRNAKLLHEGKQSSPSSR
jgi:hypothetical protein